ncbi:hypothetical protein COCVIDRAFT_104341 [Bipolaris victoriae FI3]|uniref:Uncharacterized protein n=1 Tax=Bipolaris victoriae (strain FI3) TaxID=930091 RepID=W7ELF7_BIPV3|nr:hypothetical protein COCVIDRAFT_104341 [Bipolaris victoriae FI3]
MRVALLAAIVPVALAGWNPKACNGAGGCTQVGYASSGPFVCPDGSRLNLPSFAGDNLDAGNGNADPVAKADFPKSCTSGAVPPADATFIKTKSRNNQTMFFFVTGKCDTPNPEAFNCYSKNPNPSVHTFCAMYDTKGALCKENNAAGYCERWGYSTVNPQCAYWKPGLPDLPNNQ